MSSTKDTKTQKLTTTQQQKKQVILSLPHTEFEQMGQELVEQ
jgi:hypothetical protein